MDTIYYVYNGKSWEVSSTVSDKNSFFHAAFGVRANIHEPYLDKRVKYRRSRWATFLNYFEEETMPPLLADILKQCLFANEKYEHVSVEDQELFGGYVLDIMKAEHDVTVEEIPILATLANVNVVLFKDEELTPAVIISPDIEILGSYPYRDESKGEVVLHLEGNVFSRMDPLVEDEDGNKTANVETAKESAEQSGSGLIRYKKGGNAGSEGVQFQAGLLTVFFLNALQKLTNWKLSTENKAAGKCDDVVMEWPDGAVLLQAKHRQNKKRTITFDELMSTNPKNDNFSVPKYFLSYQEIKTTFKMKEIIICTNASVDGEVMKFLRAQKVNPQSLLYYERCDCKFYKFTDEILPHLRENAKSYYEKNFQNKAVDESTITDKNIKDFLGRLQLFFDYPPENDVGKVTEQLLSHMKLSENLYVDITPLDIYTKLLGWFQQKDGVYITELYAKAILSEIWRDKRWQRLEKYKIFIQSNKLNFQNSKRLLHLTVEGGCLLQEMKIFRILQRNKTKFLFVSSQDGPEKQKQVIEAFRMPQYTILVLVWPKFAQELVIRETSCKLRQILDNFEYKKVVLVADCKNKIPQLIGLSCEIIEESITFKDLSQDSRQRLLEKENIIFQGNSISLKELFARQSTEEYAKFLSIEELEKLVRDEKVKVGTPVLELDEKIREFYVKRKFKRTVKNEDELGKLTRRDKIFTEELICEPSEKIVLISDGAGTGKSTVLTNLAATMKHKYPHLWVIRIDLNDYTQILNEILKKNKDSINILELLGSKDSTKFTNRLEQAVFSADKKVALMLDGFDEISPDYTELVLNLLSLSREQNFAKVVVTTRPHMTRQLKEKLQVEPLLLEPFTEKNQIDFLAGYWMQNLHADSTERGKCVEYAKALIEEMSSWVQLFEDETNHFAAIPLHVRMLAEIFQENNQSEMLDDWKGCKEYLATGGVELKLPVNMDVTRLYEMFIEKKRSVFIDKGNPSGNPAANQALLDQFEECLAHHKTLALELILGKTQCELFACRRQITKNLEMNVLKIGIVQKADNEFHFSHRTFAEYFVAKALIEELQLPNENVEFQKFLVEEILLKPQFVIHVFFNSFLQQITNTSCKYPCLSYKITSLRKNKLNLFNSIVRNGHSAIFQLILKCSEFVTKKPVKSKFFEIPVAQSVPEYSNILNIIQHKILRTGSFEETFLEYAAGNGRLEMVKFLVQQSANVNKGKRNAPLHLAVDRGHLEVTKFFIEHGADIRAKDWEHGTNVLYKAVSKNHTAVARYLLDEILQIDGLNITDSIIPYTAAYLGRLDILGQLIERGLNVNSTVDKDETILFGAVRGGQLETIKYLLQQGSDINIRDRKNNTVLHVISQEPSRLSTAKFLITKLKLDVNAKNASLMTALHIAAEEDNFSLVKLLIDHGANVNLVDEDGVTALHLVAEQNHFDSVQLLVDHGANVNLANGNGMTPLHIAMEDIDFNIVKLLVDHGANVNLQNQLGETALHYAVEENNFELVELFLNHDANVNVADEDGKTALHSAVKGNNFDLVELLVNHGADVDLADENGVTALHIAIEEEFFDLVELLVKRDANVNLTNSDGVTALHTAVDEENFELVELLVNHGADVDFADKEGVTALHIAAQEENLTLVELLLNHGANVDLAKQNGATALHIAIKTDNSDLVELLVNWGADVNLAKQNGTTALHIAVKRYNSELVQFLINCDANVNLAKQNGTTPLHIAIKKDKDLTELLVNHGANVNLADQKGTTPLHIAIEEDSFSLVELLLNRGANVNLADRKGKTPLHIAIEEDSFHLVELLLNRGANVNLADQKSKSPLHIAIKEDSFSLVQLLLNHGANVNLADRKGKTPLHIAVEEDSFELAELLVNRGANVNMADQKGMTPLHVAVKDDSINLIELLVNYGAYLNLEELEGN